MFQRKAIEDLRKWANSKRRKPLVLRGARQIGKTSVVELFAKEFDDFISLNLERDNERELFDNNASVQDILSAIYFQKGKNKKKGRTLLFIDEIQYSARAVTLLRYFYEDLPELYVIAAGSLLETLLNKQISFPVGRVEYLAMRPCSFSEFLVALDKKPLSEAVLSATLPNTIHKHIMDLFDEYLLVGGMPEVINTYAETKDIILLNKIYETLLTGFRDDVEKYATNATMRNAIRYILLYGWDFAGERIKFEKFANSNYKSREMGEAMRTLEKAMLLELSYPTTATAMPMKPDIKKSPKLLWLDTGLVNYASGLQREILGNKNIMDIWRGRIVEHIVGQMLLANSKNVSYKRNFWVREERNSQAEVDYVIQVGEYLIPIEVKAGNNSKLKSLNLFMEASNSPVAVRFWNMPLSVDKITLPSKKQFSLINIPFYYAEAVEEIVLAKGINLHSKV